MLEPGVQIGPYEVREPLGRGGMGEVYLAHDHRLGRELALKVLPHHATDDVAAVERFVREARAASALNHPNVITIYEIGEAEAGRYIAMELVRGETLRVLAGAAPRSTDEIARLGAQMAKALAVAHAAGIVHRDVKPENVMVRPDGYVKVLDFGIARLVATDAARMTAAVAPPTVVGRAVGTLRYMSPEQACGEAVTSATDIFSLGIVLHELATGTHPFAAASEAGTVSAILTAAALAPSASNPAVPAEFDALVDRMLDKDPTRRPTASEVEITLAEIARGPSAVVPTRKTTAPARHTVGRERERRILRQALEEVESGRGLLVSVTGEPGIGKTTLVEEFLADVSGASRPLRVARGRCSERLAGTEAYLPILEALDTMIRGPNAAPVVALMKRLAPTWYLQLAPAAAEDSSEGRALVSVQASSQERLKRELNAFLEELARSAPVVLLLEDLHWADVSTVDVLAYLGARFAATRALVLVSLRPAELLAAKHPFAQLKLDLQGRGVCRELALDFLTRGDVEQYLALEFPSHDFPPGLAALIHAKTEGSPLFMADMLRYLRTRGVVANAGGRWALAQSVPAIEHDLPESIRGMIQRKIEQLSDADRKLLAAASVQGYEFDSAIVAELTAVDPADVEEQLETLEHIYGFVRRSREQELPDGTLSVRYRFVHVLYQNALYAGLTPTRRVSLSARAAQALLDHYADRSGEIAADLAALFEAARDTRRAVAHLVVAAQNAARVFANQEALALSRRALELLAQLPDTPERAERELLLQSTCASALSAIRGMASPDVGKATARAYELWKQLGARPELFATMGGLWGYYIVAAKLDVALALGEELLRLADGTGERPMLVAAHNALALTLHHLGDHLRALLHFERGIAAYGVDLGPVFINFPVEPGVSLAAEYARTLWVVGYPDRARRQLEAALALADAVPHPEARGFAPLFGAFVHQFLADVDGTLRYAEKVLAVARERDIVTTLAWGMVLHGWAVTAQGRVDDGLSEIRGSLAAQLAAGSLIARPQFLAILADACLRAGRLDETVVAAAEGLECSAATADHYWDSELERFRGEALHALGSDTADVDACFRRAIEDARARGAKSLELRAATSAARVWESRGDRAMAHDTLAPVYAWFTEGFDTPDLVSARSLLDALG